MSAGAERAAERRPPGRRQVRLGAHFPGVNATSVWSDPASGSHIDFSSFVHMARTAERSRFDFFFLAEGLRLREKKGRIHDLDVVGRPDTLAVLAALSAVTEHLGLVGTLTTTYNEPYEVARQLATLDHLSGGRAGWNAVTSPDAFTGANFRRGGFLDRADRYDRAAEFVTVVRSLWRSWGVDDLVADTDGARFVRDVEVGAFSHRGRHFDVEGHFPLPRSPQVEPVVLQAGDSDAGRAFGATHADGIFTLARGLDEARAFSADLKGRAAAAGRDPDHLLILPAATFALGDTTEEAERHAAEVRRAQVSGATALQFLERFYNRDLSSYDPDGPLPDVEPLPEPEDPLLVQGQVVPTVDVVAQVREWRELAAAKGLSLRDLVVEVSARQTFVGTAAEIAEQIDHRVQTGAADGFILVPHLSPGGLDELAERVVPLLQERGSVPASYTGRTLRENLGLPAEPPVRNRP
ncbi:FMN-dependent oxidoreductase (nitrilotriacetate monooxygenase family) [Nocardioides zeae]|uniref:FMN-dependent oxidoreductase (Nitrilotriacetate monooxygenase family) n=1 Tax=Nocardioides zeae TaxID=1457234 RepID=A0ACC6IMM4_9ACTN|nr:NtaA/DmoA family FMN-dependent monooxygenase [Nocardioides zeae]MDR6173371.1 FMN-dependent oxidoreductase (nitrilotriacetate monooxygenase family) [Nocardioides zeae]MDR6212011.1 FMN-dependent oxidoreductase (nitrilotriacetate monooxygenase family) [Nocardioides zeae]